MGIFLFVIHNSISYGSLTQGFWILLIISILIIGRCEIEEIRWRGHDDWSFICGYIFLFSFLILFSFCILMFVYMHYATNQPYKSLNTFSYIYEDKVLHMQGSSSIKVWITLLLTFVGYKRSNEALSDVILLYYFSNVLVQTRRDGKSYTVKLIKYLKMNLLSNHLH